MISARVQISDYSNRVLGVIKAKYALKDKSEALNKFISLYGKDEVELEVKDEVIAKMLYLDKNKDKEFIDADLDSY